MRNKLYFAFRRAGSARSQTSDTLQRYVKAIPRKGEFAFDREPSPAGSARSQTSDTLQRYVKAIPRKGEFAFDREPSPAALSRQAEHSPKSGTKIRKKS